MSDPTPSTAKTVRPIEDRDSDPSRTSLKYPQYLAALAAAVGAFTFGAAIGWNSPATVMINEKLQLKPTESVWIGSFLAVGGAVATLPMPLLLNRFGRKPIMLLIAIPQILGWLILAFLETVPFYCLGRFITGFCGGSYSVAVPIFIGEIAESKVRGALGGLFELQLVLGLSFAFTVGSFADVRTLSLACMGGSILFAIVFIFIPETPYYYMARGKRTQAEKSLHWYRGDQYDTEDEMKEIEDFVSVTQEKVSIRERFTQPAARKSLVIGCGMMFMQQFTGVTPILYNALDIFKTSDTFIDPEYAQVALGLAQFVFTLFSIFIMERAGRKVFLVISLAGMGSCLTILGVYYTYHERDPATTHGFDWIPLAMLCSFIALFSIGVGPIAWLILGELFPEKIKSIACSICACLSAVLTALVTALYPFMDEGIGKNFTMWIFASLCFLFILFVIFVCVETKGKSLLQIQTELTGLKLEEEGVK